MKSQELKKKRKKPAFQVKAAEIKEKAKKFCGDRKSANEFVDVIAAVAEAAAGEEEEEEDVPTLQAGISAILKMVTFCLDSDIGDLGGGSGSKLDSKTDADSQYRLWIADRISDACNLLLSLLEDSKTISVRESALVAYVKIVVADGRRKDKASTSMTSTKSTSKAKHLVNERAFNALVRTLLSANCDMADILPRFTEYIEKVDVFHCSLLFLLDQAKQQTKDGEGQTSRNEVFWNNFFGLLESIKMSEMTNDSEWLIPIKQNEQQKNEDDQGEQNAESVGHSEFPEDRRLFSSLWTEFLRCPLPASVFKKSLVLLADHVMPFMTSPLGLTDMLIKAYDMGGVVSILALNGIFILVHRYNLEYPHFYKKLYSLLSDATIFSAKYRSRFFFLVDLFLTSTHIPAYLVCAFVKRLSRLALVAPPTGILIILSLIRNLLLKHPNAQILVHCPDGSTTSLDEDPFDPDEADPVHCRAMESSLWEVASLQNHYYSRIAKMAKVLITQPIVGMEQDLGLVLEETEDDIFAKESKSKFHHVAMNHVTPKGLFADDDANDDEVSATKCWAAHFATMEV